MPPALSQQVFRF